MSKGLTCSSLSRLMTYSVLGPYNLTVIFTIFPFSSVMETFSTARKRQVLHKLSSTIAAQSKKIKLQQQQQQHIFIS